jgi:phage/plasmid-associated DNA primase
MNHHNCNKDTAKLLPIVLMFGGSYTTWIKECDISMNENDRIGDMVEIENFMKSIIEIVYKANPQIKRDVLKQDKHKWKNDTEAKRGVMALWSQSVEKMIQEDCISYLINNHKIKIEDVVPSQDGFMILKEDNCPQLCSEINALIKDTYNIDVGWIEKPFDEGIEIPLHLNVLTFEEWLDALSVKCLADRFLAEFGDYVIKTRQGELNVYWGDKIANSSKVGNGRWYNETDKSKRYKLYLYISEDLYQILHDELVGAVELSERDISKLLIILRTNCSVSNKMNDIIKHILTKANEIDKDFNSDPFLLGFNNGVYDLKNDLFRDYTFYDYITLTTKYDYQKVDYNDPGNVDIRDQLDEIFEDIHPDKEHRELFLQVLSSGLDGRAYQKLFLFNGQGGNGKGLAGALMDTILGEYYFQPGNGILKDVERANTPSPDMFNLKNKRYINFKEVAGAVRVAMLRNLTGGGKFCGRLLNCNPETFYMSATFVMEFNTSPDLDGKPQRADYRRLVDVLFPVNFTDDPAKIGKELDGIMFKEGNTYYETQEFLLKVRQVFLDKLLDVYRTYKDKDGDKGLIFTIPQSIRDRTEKFIENQNLFLKLFNNHYEKAPIEHEDLTDVAKLKNKTLKLKEMWDTITRDEEYRRMPYRERKQYGRDEFYKWCGEQFKVEGNSKTGKLMRGVVTKEPDGNGDGCMLMEEEELDDSSVDR